MPLSLSLESDLDLGLPPSRRKRQAINYNAPQDESLLSLIGSSALGGISRVGNVLDLPGSSVRDVLGGENPFDQWLSPTTDENRLAGRDLNRRWGLAQEQDTYANWWGGLATEIATDPTTYITGGAGALTKGGKILQGIGKLDDVAKVAGKGTRASRLTTPVKDVISAGDRATREAAENAAKKMGVNLDEVGEEAVGSLARIEIPFTNIGVNVGTAQTPGALKLAKGLDIAGDAIKVSPLGRVARGLFDPVVGGEFSKTGQMAQEAKYAKVKAAEEGVRNSVAEFITPIKEIRDEFDQTFWQGIRNVATLTAKGQKRTPDQLVDRVFNDVVSLVADLDGNVDDAFKEMSLPLGRLTSNMRQRIVKLAGDMHKANDAIHQMNQLKGIKEATLEAADGFRHNPRYATGRGEGVVGAIKNLGTRTGSSMGRDEAIQYIPKTIANKMLADDAIRDAALRPGQDAFEYIANKYGKYLGKAVKEEFDEFGNVNVSPKWTPEEHAKELASWVSRHEQHPIFNNSQWTDFYKYQREAHVTGASVDAMYELLAKNIGEALPPPTHQVALADPAARETVRRIAVREVLGQAGLDVENAGDWLGAMVKKPGSDVLDMSVPEDVANAIISMRKVADPTWLDQIGKVIDAANDLFKRNVTLPFPSFASRNLMSGQFVNAVSGLFQTPQEMQAYGGKIKEAWELWRRQDGEFVKELFVNDVVDYRALSEGVPSSATTPEFGYVGAPWKVGQTFGEVSGEVADNPLFKAAGLNTAVDPLRKGYGTVMRSGEKAAGMVEFFNRVPMYLYLTREKGWTPAMAAAKVKELQIDYGALAPFEKSVMRRLAPFYTFNRKIAPVLLGILAERPGGGLAQTIRASREASGADATTPDYVSSTLSIPNPFKTPEEGASSYVTGFGLPFENLAGYAEGPRAAGREFLSQMNPLLKAPLEWSTNQSFFQTGPSGAGRPLDDLDPTIGRTLANVTERITGEKQRSAEYLPRGLEFAIANSPVSRFATTARQVSDPRKTLADTAINLLTGARVTDVSPAAHDAVLRDRAAELMKRMGSRSFEKVYFPDEAIEAMPPGDQILAQQLQALQTALATRAKARRS
jgi:hypothetical protein